MIRCIGLGGVHLMKSRITTGLASLQSNGIKFLVNQKRTKNVVQYVKRTTFATTTRSSSSRTFSLSIPPKLVPKSLIHQFRPFHATQPTRAIPMPAFLLVFKTANAALAIRTISNLLLSFLPLALRKNPKTGRPRRLLIFLTTVIPLTGFCIIILTGLEQAPHTGRWRFRFMSEEEEKELCDLAFLSETEKYKNNFLSHDRIENIFVCHVASNLIKGLNNDLMTLKSFKRLNDMESSEEVANIIEQNVENMSGKNMNTQEQQEPKPFEIYIIENDEILNACSFGASKKIVIFTGWLNLINYDEEYLAVTLSHEIAHILQRHSGESFGFNQILYMFADTIRTLLWFPFLAALGPLLNDYLNTATQVLVEKYTSGRYNQRAEKEADIVGLQLMALSGYHPKKAIELWNFLASLNNQNITALQGDNGTSDIIVEEPKEIAKAHQEHEIGEQPSVLQSLTEFFASHPLEEVRAKYLDEVLPEAEKIYEQVVAEGGQAKLFKSILNNEPIEAIKNTEEWLITKFWSSLRHLVGLNPES